MDDYDRCKYIRKQTSEDGFKRSIMKKHKKKKTNQNFHIYEMGYATIIDNETIKLFIENAPNIEKLCKLCLSMSNWMKISLL